jgi:hypothetical protein
VRHIPARNPICAMLRFGLRTKTETKRKIRQRAAITAAARGDRPGRATFVDMGGNDIRNCQGPSPRPFVTPANYATLGFNGGIVPKATVTHTPNTCHLTITPMVNAMAYALCNNLLDQIKLSNYFYPDHLLLQPLALRLRLSRSATACSSATMT